MMNPAIVLYGGEGSASGIPGRHATDRSPVTRALVGKRTIPSRRKGRSNTPNGNEKVSSIYASRPAARRTLTAGQWSEELDRATARALALRPGPAGICRRSEGASKIAFENLGRAPTGEGARRRPATWLHNLGRTAEAISSTANAFALETRASSRSRSRPRTAMRPGRDVREVTDPERGWATWSCRHNRPIVRSLE